MNWAVEWNWNSAWSNSVRVWQDNKQLYFTTRTLSTGLSSAHGGGVLKGPAEILKGQCSISHEAFSLFCPSLSLNKAVFYQASQTPTKPTSHRIQLASHQCPCTCGHDIIWTEPQALHCYKFPEITSLVKCSSHSLYVWRPGSDLIDRRCSGTFNR